MKKKGKCPCWLFFFEIWLTTSGVSRIDLVGLWGVQASFEKCRNPRGGGVLPCLADRGCIFEPPGVEVTGAP